MNEQQAPESLVVATIDFLRRYPPFDRMRADGLRFVAQHLKLAYYPEGSPVLLPDTGTPKALHIVQRGAVARRETAGGEAALTFGPGDCFSVGALMEKRSTNHVYMAAADTFCYELDAADFDALLDRSPVFREFCTRYVTTLLRQSRQMLQMELSSQTVEQQTMNSPLATVATRNPVSCAPETPIGEALATMSRLKIGSIVVVSADGEPVGIFTLHDLLDRVTLPQTPLATPISKLMTPRPRTLPAEASAHEAAFMMARYGIRHVVMVEEGKAAGVVTERDLFSLQRVSMRQINRTIASAGTLGELQQSSRDIRQLAGNMLAQGVAAEQLTLIVSALNDQLTQRILELEIARHDLAGIDWCWMAFGSEGRFEQTLSTDQDNGIVFGAADGADAVRERLLPFAQAVNATLDACGFPLCKGNIMAGNPELCLSVPEWIAKFDDWVRNPDPQALLNATIFFDFRALYGYEAMTETLREKLLAMTEGNERFLHMMARNALQVRPPLGMIRDFSVDSDGDYPGTLDLKTMGARIFVDVARIMSLATGVTNTNTAQRLRHAGHRLRMGDDELSSAIDSFFFIQMLRLRQQQADPGGAGGRNRLDPDTLNQIDRRILKEAFRHARRLQSRLELDYRL